MQNIYCLILLINLLLMILVECTLSKKYLERGDGPKSPRNSIKRGSQGFTKIKKYPIPQIFATRIIYNEPAVRDNSLDILPRSLSFRENVGELMQISQPKMDDDWDPPVLIIDSLMPGLATVLREGVKWSKEGYRKTLTLFDTIWDIENNESLEIISKTFGEALRRFFTIINEIEKEQLQKLCPETIVTKDTYIKYLGGCLLSFFIWPYCEFIKFRNIIEGQYDMYLENIESFDFMQFMDDEIIAQSDYTKAMMSAINHFIGLLEGLGKSNPYLKEEIKNHASFWIKFSEIQHKQAMEHYEIHMQKKTKQTKRASARVSRRAAVRSKLMMTKNLSTGLRVSQSTRNIPSTSQAKPTNRFGLIRDPHCKSKIEAYQYFIERLTESFLTKEEK
jgi:hypothetical protein